SQLIPQLFHLFSPLVKSFRTRFLEYLGEGVAAAAVRFRDGAANLFPSRIVERPVRQTFLGGLQFRDRLFSLTGKSGRKTFLFHRQQFFYLWKRMRVGLTAPLFANSVVRL